MFHLEIRNAAGDVVAIAAETGCGLVVQGSMEAWREWAAAFLPLVREAAAGYDAGASE